jgi:membrane associated rhomboid family serine protease
MFRCPNCQRRQVRTEVARGAVWVCQNCGGRAATIATLRKHIDRDTVEHFWAHARRRKLAGSGTRACPACDRVMVEAPPLPDLPIPPLDVCKRCQIVWFDPQEYERMPPPPAPEPVVAAPPAPTAHDPLAIHDHDPPFWQWMGLFLGLPMERAATRVVRFPWVTCLLALAICVVSLVAFLDFRNVIAEFALVPAQAFRDGGLTFVTSFFLHASWLHLVGNVYFLLLFGDNVEDYLGRLWFALLIVLAALLGDMMHIVFHPNSPTPTIGASGGISGVIAFYALRFPRAHLISRVGWFPFQLSVWVWFLIWVGVQILGGVRELHGGVGVAYLAHLGGAAVGVLFYCQDRVWSRSEPVAG